MNNSFNKSLIFSQAWERTKKTGEKFATALTAVWDFYRKNAFAKVESEKIISEWEKLNSAKTLDAYTASQKNVGKIIDVLKAAYTALVEVRTPNAIMTANIIANVVNKKSETPSPRQLWAIVCGAWENGIILNF